MFTSWFCWNLSCCFVPKITTFAVTVGFIDIAVPILIELYIFLKRYSTALLLYKSILNGGQKRIIIKKDCLTHAIQQSVFAYRS